MLKRFLGKRRSHYRQNTKETLCDFLCLKRGRNERERCPKANLCIATARTGSVFSVAEKSAVAMEDDLSDTARRLSGESSDWHRTIAYAETIATGAESICCLGDQGCR